ncbi:three-Cys-motif partner protein TcmP [Rhodoplanes sp. TEM]|uniref:Three-Cys-motif partner protein TcmP n=1 Tax=Rhodoplanes tepidamans TaxID=200616 RepID=A0ABT5JAJ3_RHOTP|nr:MULTISPECIES: three-Cys-motif partner protein TcmP [Rhodoplanes]MDC7786611.1 three-Cys-motif partner protein TcmP [Rhodoplanes tepidamans]MDC7983042.1 three-Cys-motif partner protein TcmP [Rhodoplanes sp. TEM]MDQ0356424.1 three-Cys-motif partner protein [Rhodoplanes tepidamans]
MVGGRFVGSKRTEEKLRVVRDYLAAYTKALKGKYFLIYIDAFAGTGDYALDRGDAGLFSGTGDTEGLVTRPGSAKLALELEPGFDKLIFIDKDRDSIASLERIREQNPGKLIEIRAEDSNAAVRAICSDTRWDSRRGRLLGTRAVTFLDPFALSVEWETLVAIGRTRAIDLWYLFPTNAVGRLLANNPEAIRAGWEARLNAILGGPWWREELYAPFSKQPDLFASTECSKEEKRVARPEDVVRRFISKLECHFAYVADRPRDLKRNNQPRFSLVFAVANPSRGAIDLAKRVSDHILKNQTKA